MAGQPPVGIVSEFFPPVAPGGAEWSTLALARALGGACTVLTPAWGGAQPVRQGEYTVRPLWAPSMPFSPVRRRTLWSLTPIWGAQLARWARQTGCRVFHAQHKGALLPALLARAMTPRAKVIFTIRDLALLDANPLCLWDHARVPADCGVRKAYTCCGPASVSAYGRGSRLRFTLGYLESRLYHRLALKADHLHFLSHGHRRLFQPDVLRRPYHVIPTMPPEERNYNLPRDRVGFVGRRSPGKGWPLLQKAWPDTFVVEGRSHPDTLTLMGLMKVLVVPSMTPEAWPRVAYEAMAVGTPVVGIDRGGMWELLMEGGMVGAGTICHPYQLHEAIAAVLADSEAYGRYARERFRTRFAPGPILDRYRQMYEEAVCHLTTSSN